MYSEFYFGIFTIFGKFIWQRVHLVYKVTQPKVNLTHFAFYPNKFKVHLQKMLYCFQNDCRMFFVWFQNESRIFVIHIWNTTYQVDVTVGQNDVKLGETTRG